MKRLVTLLAAGGLAAFAGVSCTPKTGGVTLDGTVNGVADGTTIYLIQAREKIDSVKVTGGKFHLALVDAYPAQRALMFDGLSYVFPFFVEPGAITVTADLEAQIPTAVFAGTPTNDQQNALNESMSAIDGKMRALAPQLTATQQAGAPEFDSLYSVYRGYVAERQQISDEVVKANPNTILAAFLVYSKAYGFNDAATMDSVLTLIAGAPANSFTDDLKVRRDALASTTIGAIAPDFTQAQADGTPFSLSSLRGKLVLIDFWASWCGPCRAENPNVVKLYNRFKDSGFEIVGVSLDNDRQAWLKAIEDDGLVWRHVSDLGGWGNAVAKQYAVRSVPHTVLVGQDGVIIAKNLRGAALESKVSEVLTGEKIEFPSTVN